MSDTQTSLPPDSVLSALAGDEDIVRCARGWLAELGSEGAGSAMVAAADALHRGAMRDVAGTIQRATRLVAAADAVGAVDARIAARLILGIAQTYGNAFDVALATFAEADAMPSERSASTDILRARIDLARVQPYARLGRLDDAARSGQAAVTSLAASGATEFAARGHANLGVIERMRQRPQKAIEQFNAALAGWGPDPVARAQLTSNLAEAYLDLGRFAEAERAFRAALAALEQAQVGHAATIVEGNLADLLSRQGRLSEALEHYERVRRRHLASDARGDAARLQAEEAEAFAQTGLLGEAVAEYRSALEELERSGLRLEAFRARLGLARALGRLGRFDEAARTLAGLEEAIRADGSAVAPGSALEGSLHGVLGELALAVGDAGRARLELGQAIPMLSSRPTEQAMARTRLVSAHLAAGDVAQARQHAAEALSYARANFLRPLEAEVLYGLARCARAEGSDDEAMNALRSSVELVESVRGSLQASRLRSAFVAEHADAAGDLLVALVRRGDEAALREALRVSESVRGRGLLDAIAGAVPIDAVAAADEGMSADLLREATTLRHEANALFSRLDRQPDLALSDEWRRAVIAVETKQRLVESRLGARERLRGVVAPPPSQAEIDRVIGSDAAHLVTCVAGGRLLAIATRAGRIEGRDLGDAAELAERVERFRFQIHRSLMSAGERAKRVEADVQGTLGSVAEAVLAPFAELLAEAPAIQVVPAGPLHAVPFGAIGLRGDVLAGRCPVATVPSLALALALASQPRRADVTGRVVVGVADDAAPSIATEARAIATLFAGASGGVSLLLGADATAEAVQRVAQDAAILHCASHGRFVAESPLRSGIRLSDGWLTVTDLYRWRLPGTIVLVSGCDTGRVAVEGGDELTGLQRGFFAAGASAVVLSAWLAHDTATLELMQEVHRRLGTCRITEDSDAVGGVAQALREAMLEVRRHRPRLVEWGGFGVVGSVTRSGCVE